jgi:alpha-L-rhamnosidase
MQTSTDEGKTWSKLRGVGGGCSGPEKNKPVQLADGTIMAGARGPRVEISRDDGETWSKYGGSSGGIGGIQPTILNYGNNRLQMLFRTDVDVKKVGVTWSDDLGKTWSKSTTGVLPNNSSGLDGVTLRNGTQMLVYNHSHRTEPEMGHKGRGFLTLSMSDDGKAWKAALIVTYTNTTKGYFQYSYPAIIETRDGLVHIVHTWGRLTINHVVVNPKALKPVAIPDGKWPSTGPLSLEEYKKANPDYHTPKTNGLYYDPYGCPK